MWLSTDARKKTIHRIPSSRLARLYRPWLETLDLSEISNAPDSEMINVPDS